jgi:hypothetical protein
MVTIVFAVIAAGVAVVVLMIVIVISRGLRKPAGAQTKGVANTSRPGDSRVAESPGERRRREISRT